MADSISSHLVRSECLWPGGVSASPPAEPTRTEGTARFSRFSTKHRIDLEDLFRKSICNCTATTRYEIMVCKSETQFEADFSCAAEYHWIAWRSRGKPRLDLS